MMVRVKRRELHSLIRNKSLLYRRVECVYWEYNVSTFDAPLCHFDSVQFELWLQLPMDEPQIQAAPWDMFRTA
ncbi:uncharacterized [Tachysurus ichikawai]